MNINKNKRATIISGSIVLNKQGKVIKVTGDTHRETKKEYDSRIQTEKNIQDYRLKNLTPILCELCNKQICLAYETDLNGSYFYCDKCSKS